MKSDNELNDEEVNEKNKIGQERIELVSAMIQQKVKRGK
jgi:hypothetical protein